MNYSGGAQYYFNETIVNETTVDFLVSANQTMHRFTFAVKFNHSAFETLYDSSRNLVQMIDSTYNVQALRVAAKSSLLIAKIIGIVCAASFAVGLIMLTRSLQPFI